MTGKELEDYKIRLKEIEKELTEHPERIKEYLYRTGMYTKKGNLKKRFKVA